MPELSMTKAIAAALDPLIRARALAGAATLVWHDGQVVHAGGVGWRDEEAGLPVERDTLFRIASMTKPITSVAALMLCEEGRWALDDPIARWAPELAEMRVLRSPTGPLDHTDPAVRAITIDDLLTHRSGLTYGPFQAGPIAAAYAHALGGDIDSLVSPDDWIANLASLPLIDQPGSTLHYGHSTDLLGLLIARVENAPLGDVLARRIFNPLGMKDTGFTLSQEQAGRQARLYGFDDEGRLTRRLRGPGGSTMEERPEGMAFESGGQGLWSTMDDYLAFARIFLHAGAVDGVRILQPATVARMTANCLAPHQRASAEVGGLSLFAAGHGYGMGVAMVLEPEQAMSTLVGGGAGAVGWPGGFGGWWRADPAEQSVRVFLAHNIIELEQFARGIGFGVYEAIVRFQGASVCG